METTDKRERILQAAKKPLRNRRFHEFALQEVAQAARVGKGAIYRYFEDKDDFFSPVATSGFNDMGALVERHGFSKGRFLIGLLATVRIVKRGVEAGVVRPDPFAEVLAMYLPGMLRTRTRHLKGFPGERRSHRVLLERSCNGTLEHDMPPRSPRGRKRDLACAL